MSEKEVSTNYKELFQNPSIPIKHIKTELLGHKSYVYVIKYSKEGDYLMSGSQDRSIKLWNPNKKMIIKSYENIHSQDVLDIAITSDNTKFSSCGAEKQVYYNDVNTGNVLRRFHGHTGRVNTIAFNTNESVLVSGSYDCSVRLWDLKSQSRDPIQTLTHAKDSISKVIVLDDKILSASVDGCVRVYDIRMGSLQTDCMDMNLNGMDVSFDGKFIIVSGLDSTIRLFDLEMGEIINKYSEHHISKNYSSTIKFNHACDKIYSTSEDYNIVCYDILDPNKYSVFSHHQATTSGLEINPVKKEIFASCSFDRSIVIWEIIK